MVEVSGEAFTVDLSAPSFRWLPPQLAFAPAPVAYPSAHKHTQAHTYTATNGT